MRVESTQEKLNVVPNSVVDRQGAPRFGTFQGELPAVDLRRLAGRHRPRWWHWRARRKKWHYTIGVTDEVLICQAVVEGGYFGQGFMYVVDLYEERAVAEISSAGLPGMQARVNDRPGRGHHSSYRAPGIELALERGESSRRYRWKHRLHSLRQREPGGLALDADIDLEGAGPPLTVISPVDGGVVNVTQKWAGLAMAGELQVGSRSYRLDDGLVGLDYTQGLLGRRTSWNWALGMGRLSDGRPVGLNLVAGFNDGDDSTNENALWVGDQLISLGRAHFEYQSSNPEHFWTVRTDDGAVDLYFEPCYVYRESRDWKVIDSYFVQPAGRFEGTIEVDGQRRPVTLFGVTEDQDVLW